jgi:hypothetical protein
MIGRRGGQETMLEFPQDFNTACEMLTGMVRNCPSGLYIVDLENGVI